VKGVETGSPRAPGRLGGRGAVVDSLLKYYIQWLLVAALVVLAALNANFRQPRNLENILLQSSFAGIGAAGMTLLIVAGAFDLSVAGILGVCGVVMATLVAGANTLLGILAALVVGAGLGIVNGFVVTKLRIPAFIATLGMMNVYLGIGFIWTNGQVVSVAKPAQVTLGTGVVSAANPVLLTLGTGTLFGILPVPFLVMAVVYGLCYLFLRRTHYGRFLRAVGSSELAARAVGIPVARVRIVAFVMVAVCTAIAAVLLTGELSSANAIMATGYELNVIAIVVVGGTSLQGGQGTLLGSFTGALFFAVISNALNIFGVGAYWQYVVSGVLLISAIAVQAVRSFVFTVE
jgi:ribose transport system permease protein